MAANKPRPLDQFPAAFHKVLERVKGEDRFIALFNSDREAMIVRADFYRYKSAVIAYMPPGAWETEVVKNLLIQRKGLKVEFSQRSKWSGIANLERQVAEKSQPAPVDEEASSLEDLDQELMEKYGQRV